MNDYRILVVDDEEDLCEILKFNLENEGTMYSERISPCFSLRAYLAGRRI